jgi:hypothetical protein
MYFQDISTTIMIHVYDFNVYFPIIMLHNTKTMQVHGLILLPHQRHYLYRCFGIFQGRILTK